MKIQPPSCLVLSAFLRLLTFSILMQISACDSEEQPKPIEYGSAIDIDGNVYKTVKIGSQWWMAENLKVTRFRNGDPISYISATDSSTWANSALPLSCRYQALANAPGLLYNQACLSDSRLIAPDGWHVATDQDWKALEQTIGMDAAVCDKTGWRGTDQGDQLKAQGLDYWTRFDGVWATDLYGFSAKAGGCRLFDARFSYPSGLVYSGFWWTSSPNPSGEFWYRHLDYKSSGVFRSHTYPAYGMSIRCVKD
jgi:uncharacterized protein (TIGR02145 family)